MEQLGDNTWIDCQYLNEANEALYECRYALQYTYVYAYYLPKEEIHREHFEMQQTELERQTEDVRCRTPPSISPLYDAPDPPCLLSPSLCSLSMRLTPDFPHVCSPFPCASAVSAARQKSKCCGAFCFPPDGALP